MKNDQSQDIEADLLRARIGWFYFVGGMTQQQIADKLQVTRLRVNRIIGQIRADGSVIVDLRLPLVECVKLEEAVKQRYGLEEAAVLPATEDYGETQRTIGEAAGQMLENHMGRYEGVGIGWGKTLSYSVRRLSGHHGKLSHVVGLMGATTRGSGNDTTEVATAMANAIDVECFSLTAPIYCRTSADRDSFLQDEMLMEAMHHAEVVQPCLISCADLTHRSRIMSLPRVQQALPELLEKEAVGSVLGFFLDPAGNVIDHPLNRSIMALPAEKLREKPVSILASGGRSKLPIIRAILRGKYVNRLVTDETVARALLYET